MTHTDQLHPRVQFTDQEGLLTPFAFKFLASVYEKLGGPNDLIQELEVGELYEPGLETGLLIETINDLESHEFQHQEQEEGDYPISQVPVQMFTAVTKNTSYTALPFDFVAMTTDGEIKLPENPDDNDQVMCVNVNGTNITFDGNGKYINDDTTAVSSQKNTTVIFQYFIDLDKWFIRMATQLDDIEHKAAVEELLKIIADELRKSNIYNELGHEEKITEEDIEK